MQRPMPRQQPYWVDRYPASRRPSYAAFRGERTADIVVVGGGLTGAVCALSFQTAGAKVVLLEAAQIGRGATGASHGLVRPDFDASFHDTVSAYGIRTARTLWQGLRRASLDTVSSLKRLGVRAEVQPADLLSIASREADAVRVLRREHKARRDAGLDHGWVAAPAVNRQAALDSGGAIRTRGAALDPYRACLGVAAAAAARGTAVHEQSAARRVRATRAGVEVVTDGGWIQASAVLVATSAAIQDLRPLRRHLRAELDYGVVTDPLPASMRREVGARTAALLDDERPRHLLRWLKEDRILFSGGAGPELAPAARAKAAARQPWELMYELSRLYPAISGIQPGWTWDALRYGTSDGLPFIGTHRNYPRHLFALGEARHGAALAWLAARVLLRAFQGTPERGDEAFGFGRIL